MKKNWLTILLLFFMNSSFAQLQLTPVLDMCLNDSIEAAAGYLVCKPLPNGTGYVIVGESRMAFTDGKPHHGLPGINFGGYWSADAYIAITDNNFNVLKSNIFGGTTNNDENDYFKRVFPQPDGGFVCFGRAESIDGDIQSPSSSFALLLFKVDSNLNKVWSKPYGSNATSIWEMDCIQSKDGGFIMLGANNGPSGDNNMDYDNNIFMYDWTVVKTDANGDKEWAWVYGSSSDEYSNGAIMEDIDRNIYIASSSYESDNDCVSKDTSWRLGLNTLDDIFVLKIDSSGNRLWTQSYGGTHSPGGATYESPLCALYDSVNNELLLGGQTDSKDLLFPNTPYYRSSAFFLRLDTAGLVKQVKKIEGNWNEQVWNISLGPQPNTYFLGLNTTSIDGDMAGYVGTGSGVFLCLIDQQGNFLMRYGENNLASNSFGYAAIDNSNSEVILFGNFGGDVSLSCDTSYVLVNNKKRAIRRLRFDPLGVENTMKVNPDFILFPNPSIQTIYLKTDYNKKVAVFIHDLNGRLLFSGDKVDIVRGIDISNFALGSYLVTLKIEDRTVHRKIIIAP